MDNQNNVTIVEPKKRNRIPSYILLFVVVALAGIYLVRDNQFFKKIPNANPASTTTPGITGDAIIEIDDLGIGDAPKLDSDLQFQADISTEARSLIVSKYEALEATIAKEPYSYESWMKIGQLLMTTRDYDGARDAWEYAAKIIPTSPIAFSSLGFLYGYNLKDYVRAESNYKKALENAPSDLALYQQVFEFYRDVLKDKSKANALISEGLKKTGNKEFFENLRANLN